MFGENFIFDESKNREEKTYIGGGVLKLTGILFHLSLLGTQVIVLDSELFELHCIEIN